MLIFGIGNIVKSKLFLSLVSCIVEKILYFSRMYAVKRRSKLAVSFLIRSFGFFVFIIYNAGFCVGEIVSTEIPEAMISIPTPDFSTKSAESSTTPKSKSGRYHHRDHRSRHHHRHHTTNIDNLEAHFQRHFPKLFPAETMAAETSNGDSNNPESGVPN